jgi:hypothetical protein
MDAARFTCCNVPSHCPATTCIDWGTGNRAARHAAATRNPAPFKTHTRGRGAQWSVGGWRWQVATAAVWAAPADAGESHADPGGRARPHSTRPWARGGGELGELGACRPVAAGAGHVVRRSGAVGPAAAARRGGGAWPGPRVAGPARSPPHRRPHTRAEPHRPGGGDWRARRRDVRGFRSGPVRPDRA